MKYVYILKVGDNHYKIGVGVSVTKRVAELQTSNPHKIRVVMTRLVSDPYKVEQSIHQLLSSYRLQGGREWFEMTPEQVIEIAIQLNEQPDIDLKEQITLRTLVDKQNTQFKLIEDKLTFVTTKYAAILEEEAATKRIEAEANARLRAERERANASVNNDEIERRAIEICKMEGRISTSLLQRRLQIGYSRAARVMDNLEIKGLITAQDGVRPRTLTDSGYNS